MLNDYNTTSAIFYSAPALSDREKGEGRICVCQQCRSLWLEMSADGSAAYRGIAATVPGSLSTQLSARAEKNCLTYLILN